MKGTTFKIFFATFLDDESCLNHLMDVRYDFEHKCRKCERDSKLKHMAVTRTKPLNMVQVNMRVSFFSAIIAAGFTFNVFDNTI